MACKIYQFISTDDCGHTFTTKHGMVSRRSDFETLLTNTEIGFKGTDNNGKDLQANRKDPYAITVFIREWN